MSFAPIPTNDISSKIETIILYHTSKHYSKILDEEEGYFSLYQVFPDTTFPTAYVHQYEIYLEDSTMRAERLLGTLNISFSDDKVYCGFYDYLQDKYLFSSENMKSNNTSSQSL